MNITNEEPPTKQMSGPKSLFRGKIRQPISVLLTRDGHRRLAEHTKRTSLSRADLMEALLTEYGHLVPDRKDTAT